MPSDPPVRASGLEAHDRLIGRCYYWRPPRAAKRLGYEPVVVRVAGDDTTDAGRSAILATARRLQADAQRWLSEKEAPKTCTKLGDLLDRYQRDAESPYRALKWNTRRDYDREIERLRAGGGGRLLSTLKHEDFARWYGAALEPREAGGPPRVRSAHGLMTMLRIVVSYGAAVEIAHCARVEAVLGRMRFKVPKPRVERPTVAQATAIIDKAIEMGALSIAIGQALQFDGLIRQSNVTGQWRPLDLDEDPSGGITLGRRVWEDGIRWSDIGPDGVLRFETSKRGHAVEIDLSLYPLVARVFALVPAARKVGPIVIDERAGRPYAEKEYSKRWRKIADAAGVPRTIWNRDSRAGGITDARDSGADLHDTAKQAAHADPNFTATVYARDQLAAARRVAQARADARKNAS